MNCKKCGNPLLESDQFCKNCGAPVNEINAQNQFYGMQQPINNGIIEEQMNNYNSQSTDDKNIKNNNKKTLLMILGLIIIVAVILIIVLVGNNNNNSNKNSNYEVEFREFLFKIPVNLTYLAETDHMVLINKEKTQKINIQVIEGNYNDFSAKKDLLKDMYESINYNCKIELKTIEGINFTILELTKDDTNGLYVITEANSTNLFGITIYNTNNEYDYNLLETIASILSETEYTGINETITLETIDIEEISNLANLR